MHLFIKFLFIYLIFSSNVLAAKLNYFEEGKIFFEQKNFEKSKILFEKSIVFNPKDEKSYLYLAKIFKTHDNDQQQEMNLNSVLLLNPKNDEAIYMLTLLKIKQSDYDEAKKLIKKFNLVCIDLCLKSAEIKEKFDKLVPKDAKDNN